MFQKSSARKEIDSKIDALKKQFQAIKKNLATDEDLQKFVAEFGNLTHAEAVQLNLENDAFISRLTTEEEFEQYFKITPS
jgi:seryl-tRNA synthetase